MRYFRFAFLAALLLAGNAGADVTRVATFENYAAGDFFQPSFTDPLSGITFRDSTNPPMPGGFAIDFSTHFFGGGNYLTAGIGPSDGFGASFGFIADLPAGADRITLQAIYLSASRSEMLVQGFNSLGNIVAQAQGPAGNSNLPFTLEISSGQFDITKFRVSVGGGASGYDNISYTILPEPASVIAAIGVLAMGRTGRNHGRGLR